MSEFLFPQDVCATTLFSETESSGIRQKWILLLGCEQR